MKTINYTGSSKLIARIVNLLNRKVPLPLDGDGDPDWGTNGQFLTTDGAGGTAWSSGGGGGDTVSWTQDVTTGTKIASIDINGNSTDVYAPSGGSGDTVSWTQITTTGTKIAEIDINGTSTNVYAPTSGGSTYTEGDGIDINSSNVISVDTTFTEADSRVNIASGDTFSTILGKIKKFFTDLKTVAFTGAYSDLSGTPTLGAAASKGVALNLTTQVPNQYVLDAFEGYALNEYRKQFILGKKVYVSASVTGGNDYPISCSIPSGYIPLCVTCSSYMCDQGIMGSPYYATSGTTKCRWKNLTSGTVTLNAQLCVFYFVKNEITVS